MGCGCGGASKKIKEPQTFTVTRRDGSTVDVNSEYDARVEITRSGGGTFKPKR